MDTINYFVAERSRWSVGFALIKKLYQGYFNNSLTLEEYLRELDLAANDPGFVVVMAEKDTELVGIVFARQIHFVFWGNILWLHSLYVRPEVRKCGIARGLFTHAQSYARDRGLKAICFNGASSELNADYEGIDAFHTSCGSKAIGTFWVNEI